MQNLINFIKLTKNFDETVKQIEHEFHILDMPDYAQEEFYRGLSQVKVFSSYLKQIIDKSNLDK